MEKQQIESLQKLSWAEKFDLIQILWRDIAAEQEKLDIPESHKALLTRRLERIAEGKAKFRNWNDIRSKYIERRKELGVHRVPKVQRGVIKMPQCPPQSF
jgi:putative addiction module component (TIGR02574 family)